MVRAARLGRAFYERHTVEVARDLLGRLVMRKLPDGRLAAGRIVETEAYHGPDDQASHAFRGQTPRNAPMFGPAGVAYVYQIYGVWFCLNTVTGGPGFPAAVLVRAVAPVEDGVLLGLDKDARAGAGPGKLCRALAIDTRLTGKDLVMGDDLWLACDGGTVPGSAIGCGPRIGVGYAGEWAERPWRFWVIGHPAVSRKTGAPRRASHLLASSKAAP